MPIQVEPMKEDAMIEETRMDITKLAPEAYRHLVALERTVAGKIEPKLYHLIKLRASQINGCAFCIGMHTDEALRDGESFERIALLDAWEESSLYSDKERVALEWTEDLTLIADTRAPTDSFDKLKEHFSEEEVAYLTLAATMINNWNRIAISSRSQYNREDFQRRTAQAKVPEPA
jgi:AhpD family alkylhydroperoxidase